jgi:serine protease Do
MTSGDIIKSVDDKPVKNVNELVKEILKKKVGQTVKLSLIRDGKEMTLDVITSAQPEKPEPAREKEKGAEEKLGASVEDLTPEMVARYGISGIKRGVVITGVESGSPAEEIGFQEGDVILEINRRKVESLRDFERVMKDASLEKGILFHIHRKGKSFYKPYKR